MVEYIDEAAKSLMNYHPVDGMYGAMRIGKYLVMGHGEGIYSLRRADSDMLILARACSPFEAVSKAQGTFEDD